MDKKKEYYQQKREHILMMHKTWRHKQPKNLNNEFVYCVACKMMFPTRRIKKKNRLNKNKKV
jgi:Pyruvate/2-oxoacid:ferredoxin oxidoreductase delta subunit